MLETIFAIYFSIWFIIPAFIGILFFTYYDYNTTSFFLMVALAWSIIATFAISAVYVWLFIIAYIPIGIFWSLHRWKKYCRKRVEHFDVDAFNDADFIAYQLSPTTHIGRIMTWVWNWPFSFLGSILSDIIESVTTFVKEHLIQIYNKIASDAVESAKGDKK